MSSKHHATFNWGAGPQTVYIAGNFNNWDGDATPLQKQPDGSFAADVPMPWGETQAVQCVVDGEWKVREDEAKEWDAAGNMNNVYTAPHAPASNGSGAAPVPATTSSTATSVPSASKKDTATPSTPSRKTQPETLMAASAPGAASGGYTLGAVSGYTPTKTSSPWSSSGTTTGAPTTSGTQTSSFGGTGIFGGDSTTSTTTRSTEPTSTSTKTTESAVMSGTTGTESVPAESQTYLGSAMATLGAVFGNAATAVEKATGVEIIHSQPVSVPEAESKGINTNSLAKVEGPSDTVSPAGTKPSGEGVAALDEKMQNLKTNDSGTGKSRGAASSDPYSNAPAPLPKEDDPEHDIPAQVETQDKHNHVPMPQITDLSERDPKKDRTLHSDTNTDSVGTKPISSDPAVDAKSAKLDAERHPGATGSTGNTANNTLLAGTAIAKPDATSANVNAPPPASTAAGKSSSTGVNTSGTTTAEKISNAAATTSPGTAETAPTTATSSITPMTPATPAKVTSNAAATPISPTPTSASTPAKQPVHTKQATDGDVRKRKSSFFAKMKSKFNSHSKDNNL